MSNPYRPSRYRAYLLRFWEECRGHPELPGTWRFSLEDPHTGRRRGLASLERLVAFLQQEMAGGETAPENRSQSSKKQGGYK
jgi:hypothetical protein